MAKSKEEIKRLYKRFSQPIGSDAEKDDKDLQLFLNFIEKITKIGWIIISIMGAISLYLLITREIL